MIYGTLNERVKSFGKGSFHSISWNKQLKTRKGVTARVEKVSKATSVRFGVDYSNIEKVKKENGINPETGKANNQGLKWGEWLDFPYFIQHKENVYLRVTLSPKTKIETKFYVDGKEVAKEEAVALCLKSEFPNKGEMPTVFTVKTENVLEVK